MMPPISAPANNGTIIDKNGGKLNVVAITAPAIAPKKHAPSAIMLNMDAWNMMQTAIPVKLIVVAVVRMFPSCRFELNGPIRKWYSALFGSLLTKKIKTIANPNATKIAIAVVRAFKLAFLFFRKMSVGNFLKRDLTLFLLMICPTNFF